MTELISGCSLGISAKDSSTSQSIELSGTKYLISLTTGRQ